MLLKQKRYIVAAIVAIKTNYQVKKDWMGDPCVPKTLSWDGLSCSYAISSPPRIKSVHLSFSGLNIDVSFYFAKLKALEYLDLSHNKLEGSIPYVLSQLPSLMVMCQELLQQGQAYSCNVDHGLVDQTFFFE